MPIPVALAAVAEELELVSDDVYAYINRQTGELLSISVEDLATAEEEYDPEEYADWEQENLAQAGKVLDSTDFVRLPTAADIDEWEMMKAFAEALANERQGEDLLHRIHGSGAFRRFKEGLYHHKLQEEWFRFQKQALAKIAAEFLETAGIPYEG